jgi:hypothetical protein
MDLEYYDLDGAPLVRVYKNLLPSLDKLMDILKKSEQDPDSYKWFGNWIKWNNLGTNLPIGTPPEIRPEDISNDTQKLELKLMNEIMSAYNVSLKHYADDYNIPGDRSKWYPDGPAIYRYKHDLPAPTEFSPEFAMNYHTDYVFSLSDNPGKKPITTCTMYLNDDYDGGEMVFNIERRLSKPYYKRAEQFDDSEEYLSGRVVYRPVAGDVVVFPSGNPDFLSENGFYFHSVNRITRNDKYFLSIFNSYEYEGSEYFREGVEEYGLDMWLWLEKKRVWQSGYRNKALTLEDENGSAVL